MYAIRSYYANKTNNIVLYALDSTYSSTISSGMFIRNDANVIILDKRTDAALNAVSESVVASFIDNGSSIERYRNSIKASTNAYTRSGTFTLNRTTIGVLDRLTNAGWCNDHIFGMIITRSALTDSQRIQCERYLSHKSGVLL